MTTSKTKQDNGSNPFLFQSLGGGGAYLAMGIQLAFSWGVLIGGGVWLDRHRGGGIFYTLGGLSLGLILMVYELWKIGRRMSVPTLAKMKNASRERPEERDDQ